MEAAGRTRCGARALQVLAACLWLLLTLPAAAAAETAPEADVVVIGVGGLSWESVDPGRTPTLWALLEDGAAAGTSTLPYLSAEPCSTDGWLTLAAGNRIGNPSLAGPDAKTRCTPVPVLNAGDGTRIGGWPRLSELAQQSLFEPEVGSFAEALEADGVCATAVGPGAALALADPRGSVGRYVDAYPYADSEAVLGCPLTVIDGGSLGTDDPATSLADVDRLVGSVSRSVDAGTRVLVVGVSFELEGRRDMGVALLAGAEEPSRYLSVPSTRRDGIVRLQDVPSTVLGWLGIPAPASFEGAAMTLGGNRPDTLSTVAALREVADRDRLLRKTAGAFLDVLVVAGLLLVGAAVLAVRNRWGARVVYALEAGAWAVASMPIASYLVTLSGWWSTPRPLTVLWLLIAALSFALAAVTMLVRHTLWHPVLLLAGVTVGLLVLDASAGTPLHHGSPLGPSPMIGGRYYGFGNETFAVFGVHVLLLAAAIATPLLAAGRRGLALVAAATLGAGAVVVNVWPTLGADVGGGLALVPAVLVLCLALSGRRVTAARLALGALGGVACVLVIGLADWLRPANERTHVGRFFQQVLDGTAHDVLLRKADYAVNSFTSGGSAVVALVALGALVAVQVRRDAWSPRALEAAVAMWPPLRAAVLAITVLSVVGVLGNDYGIRIARLTLAVALPVLAALMLRGLRTDPTWSASPRAPDGARVRDHTAA